MCAHDNLGEIILV